MLDERKLKFIDLLIEGRTSKTDMAKLIGVHRTSLYDWLEEDAVQAELHRRLQLIKNQGEKKIASQLEPVIDELFRIALTATDTRSRNNACQYLVNRVLGTPTSNVSVDSEVTTTTDTRGVLNEFKRFVKGIDVEDGNDNTSTVS